MTLDEIRDEIWTALGEPTDIDPDTDATTLNRVVNEAQRQIAKWRDPATGKMVRIHSLFNYLYFYPTIITNTITSVSNSTFPYYFSFSTARTGNTSGRYNGWVIEITSGDADGEKRLIMDYERVEGSYNKYYYSEAFGTAPSAGDTVKLYKNYFYMLPSTHGWVDDGITLPSNTDSNIADGNLLEVLRIEDVENQTVIEKAENKESFVNIGTSTGDPTKWYRFGNRIIFDYHLDEEKWYKMEYYRLPAEMSAASDEPEIPEIYHWAMVLWGIWWGYKRAMENSSAYSTKKDLEDEMRRTINQFDVAGYRSPLKINMLNRNRRYK